MSKVCLCCGKKLRDDATSPWHDTCVKSFFGTVEMPKFDIDDQTVSRYASQNVGEGKTVTGVQKKLSLSLSGRLGRKTIGYAGEFIVKTPDQDRPFLPEFEFIGMKMADLCGFKTVPCGLVENRDGQFLYISKRIDRKKDGDKSIPIAMEDFAQLSLTQTEYKYTGSYERCVKKVIDVYSNSSTFDRIEFFRMVFFSYLIGNTDMHLKNFSLIKGVDGYSLAPFYDIVPVMMVVNQEEMALTVNGKRRNLTKNDFLSFADSIGLHNSLAKRLMEDTLKKLDEAKSFAFDAPIPAKQAEKLEAFIDKRSIPFRI